MRFQCPWDSKNIACAKREWRGLKSVAGKESATRKRIAWDRSPRCSVCEYFAWEMRGWEWDGRCDGEKIMARKKIEKENRVGEIIVAREMKSEWKRKHQEEHCKNDRKKSVKERIEEEKIYLATWQQNKKFIKKTRRM